jgi:hypothetical protein
MTWAEVPGDPPVWGTAQASLYVDLMVLGQHDPEDPLTWDVPRDFVEIAEKFAIRSVPTLMLFDRGRRSPCSRG